MGNRNNFQGQELEGGLVSKAQTVPAASRIPWGFPVLGLHEGSPRGRLTSSSAHSEGSTVWEGRQNCWHTPRL